MLMRFAEQNYDNVHITDNYFTMHHTRDVRLCILVGPVLLILWTGPTVQTRKAAHFKVMSN